MRAWHRTISRPVWLGAALLTVLFMLACNLVAPVAPSATTNPASATGSPPPPASAAAPGGSQPSPAATGAPSAFDFTAGLDQLHSYQVDFLETDRGQLDGRPYATHSHISRRVVVQPFAEDSTIDDLLADGSPLFLQYVRLGDAQYFQEQSGGPCQGAVNPQPSGQIPNRAELLPPLSAAEKVGADTLDGLPVTHYRFDAQALGLRSRSAAGEMWLASPDGLVVKYQLEIQPPDHLTGEGLEIQQSLQYTLTSLNQLAPLALPSVCIPVLTDIPAITDALGVDRRSASLSFTTASSLAQVAAFYDQALPALGWASSREPGQDPKYGLSYTKDQQTLSIVFFQGAGGLHVQVVLLDPDHPLPQAVAAATPTPPPGPAPTPLPTPTYDMAQSGLPADVPLYPAASGVQSLPGVGISFQTADSADQVAAFYTAHLKSSGWQLVNQANPGSTLLQTWMKAKTLLNITIQNQNDHRMVSLLAAAQP